MSIYKTNPFLQQSLNPWSTAVSQKCQTKQEAKTNLLRNVFVLCDERWDLTKSALGRLCDMSSAWMCSAVDDFCILITHTIIIIILNLQLCNKKVQLDYASPVYYTTVEWPAAIALHCDLLSQMMPMLRSKSPQRPVASGPVNLSTKQFIWTVLFCSIKIKKLVPCGTDGRLLLNA